MGSALEETLAAAGYAKVIVTLSPRASAAATATTALAEAGVPRGLAAGPAKAEARALEDELQSRFIIPSESQSESLALEARGVSRRSPRIAAAAQRRVRVFPHLALAIGYVDENGASALASDNRIIGVALAPELSLIRPVASRPAKGKKVVSWGLQRLGIERLWSEGFDGGGIVVGHLDTGIDGGHPALKGTIAAFAEFDLTGDQVPGAKPHDSGEHGTHTAGTIVGRAGPRGSFGMAPGAKVASAMVIEGGQVIDRILAGMDWIVERGSRVLSMSLGLRGFTPAFQTVVDAVRTAGVLPVIAVGNEGPSTSRSPGNYANVVSVGALDLSDTVAGFSGSQKFNRAADPLVPDLVAPGVQVVSCVPGGGFAEMDGSSMATPHIAGLAAVLLQAKPSATVDELENAIFGSCRRPSTVPESRGNRGVPDAAIAFQLLTGNVLPTQPVIARARKKQSRGRASARRPKPAKKPATSRKSARTRIAAAPKSGRTR